MTETSFPYAGAPAATEEQWSEMMRYAIEDGVYADDLSSTALKATSAGMILSLNPGKASVNGFHYKNDATPTWTIPANGGASTRYDRLVIRSSQSANHTVATYLTGGASPPPFAVDRSDVWDLPNVQIPVPPGATGVTLADERLLKPNGVDVGGSAFRRDPKSGLIRIEKAITGNPEMYVGTGSAWKRIYPGDKMLQTALAAINSPKDFATNNSWQAVSPGWPALQIPGVQAGDQLHIHMTVSTVCNHSGSPGGATGGIGMSWQIAGVGIGTADYSHEILNREGDGFTYTDDLTEYVTATSGGTAVITPRGRTDGFSVGRLVRGTLSGRIVR